jgi:DNA-binding NarL/FixJ family response regulator
MMSITSPVTTGQGLGSTTTGVPVGRVVVVARLQLVAQAVGAALRELGVEAEPLSWHRATDAPRRSLGADDVVVMIDDLASPADVEAASRLIARLPARCVVLSGRPPGPAWGALLAAGADAVLTSERSLGEINAAVYRVACGEVVMDEDRRAELMSSWDAWRAEDERLRARLARLSPREQQVLLLLSRGRSVVEIIDTLGIAEATVRSHVKSLRRKLGVDSQLGAVALFHRLEQTVTVRGRARPHGSGLTAEA